MNVQYLIVGGGADGVALPSATVISKILHVGFIYNTDNALNKWCCVGSQQET